MECIRAHIFVAIDCGEEQMQPAQQTVKEQKMEHQEGGMHAMQPVVMLVIAGVAMFSVIGGDVPAGTLLYIKRNQEQRRSGDGQHGTARFATREGNRRIPMCRCPMSRSCGARGETPAGCTGTWYSAAWSRHGKLYALVDTGDVHCLMIGAAGSRKDRTTFSIPTLEYACACGMSFLTTDTKGDLYRNYAGIAKKYYGYQTAVIDLTKSNPK